MVLFQKGQPPLYLSKVVLGEQAREGIPVGRLPPWRRLLCQGSESCSSNPAGCGHYSGPVTAVLVYKLCLFLPFPRDTRSSALGSWWLLPLGRVREEGNWERVPKLIDKMWTFFCLHVRRCFYDLEQRAFQLGSYPPTETGGRGATLLADGASER